jgi:hypothetical protein
VYNGLVFSGAKARRPRSKPDDMITQVREACGAGMHRVNGVCAHTPTSRQVTRCAAGLRFVGAVAFSNEMPLKPAREGENFNSPTRPARSSRVNRLGVSFGGRPFRQRLVLRGFWSQESEQPLILTVEQWAYHAGTCEAW